MFSELRAHFYDALTKRLRILLIKDQFDVSRIPETWKFLSWSLFRERFERSKAIERLERLELAAACVSDWNVWNALNNWNEPLSMELTPKI
jgi:hypothetical protein